MGYIQNSHPIFHSHGAMEDMSQATAMAFVERYVAKLRPPDSKSSYFCWAKTGVRTRYPPDCVRWNSVSQNGPPVPRLFPPCVFIVG
eukprot:5242111-Pyramimonas_sp.AAC.1